MAITVGTIKQNKLRASKKSAPLGDKKLLNSPPLVLDLFAGAGGLSEGFIKAGCEIVGHIEMEKNSCDTLTTRAIYYALKKKGKLDEYRKYVLGEITKEELIEKHELHDEQDSVICDKISEDTYLSLIDKIKQRLDGRQLDIIIGGPPCQAYSYIGRARDKQNMRDDERNYLYKYYIEFLKALKPKAFIFENVPGIVTAGGGDHLKNMRASMKEAGYDTDYNILNAADYGVPQNRKRVILVGWSKDSGMKGYPDFQKVSRNYIVKDFFADLPAIQAGDEVMLKEYTAKNKLLHELGIIDDSFNVLFDHVTRPHNDRDLEIYRMAVVKKESGENLKYDQLPSNLKTHKNDKVFLDRFKVVNQEVAGSHTVVAHIGKDGHFYIHPDISQNRSLSVREAARLQTFPDDYKFEGARGPRFKQIGNAVPPMLSSVIAKTLLSELGI
jgi:DNA (cytosine-5)-methyltransferase 1